MIAAILTFFISLILLSGILGYKIILLRKGEILPETNHTPLSLIPPHIDLRTLKADMIEYAKKYAHNAVVNAIRYWVKASYFIKREKKELIEKAKSLIPKKHKDMKAPPAVSEFLQNMSEYKAKLAKMKEKIKAEEEQNF
jgi:hypothetical protein